MGITAGQVQQSLETIDSRFRPILDDGAGAVIVQAKSMLLESKEAFDVSQQQGRRERPTRPWGFRIGPNNPLRFAKTMVNGLDVRVDLFLSAYWEEEPAERPVDLRVVIRVWSLEPQVYFRKEWDAPALEHKTNPDTGRVMLRVHFDLANSGQAGPHYHLQVGGNARPDELHWFPEALSVPRMLHMPMDLVLASELVAATFYPDAYKNIRREPAWTGSLRVSQSHLLEGYFGEALAAVRDNKSVLDSLWNASWDDE